MSQLNYQNSQKASKADFALLYLGCALRSLLDSLVTYELQRFATAQSRRDSSSRSRTTCSAQIAPQRKSALRHGNRPLTSRAYWFLNLHLAFEDTQGFEAHLPDLHYSSLDVFSGAALLSVWDWFWHGLLEFMQFLRWAEWYFAEWTCWILVSKKLSTS